MTEAKNAKTIIKEYFEEILKKDDSNIKLISRLIHDLYIDKKLTETNLKNQLDKLLNGKGENEN